MAARVRVRLLRAIGATARELETVAVVNTAFEAFKHGTWCFHDEIGTRRRPSEPPKSGRILAILSGLTGTRLKFSWADFQASFSLQGASPMPAGRRSAAGWLAATPTRARIQAAALFVLAIGVLGVAFARGASPPPGTRADKAAHFELGREIAAGVFLAAYATILLRILLVRSGSLTRILLWLPALLFLFLVLAASVVFALSLVKEGSDAAEGKAPDWGDVEAGLAGAATLAPAVAVVMALTPLLIPLDVLAQMPKLLRADVATGFDHLDDYLALRRKRAAESTPPAVLLVEDDLVCATTALSFCRSAGLPCEHVETITAAEEGLRLHAGTLRLILLDVFVRVERTGQTATGADWLRSLSARWPKEERPFLVVMITGHSHFLGVERELADLVLQKPWRPLELRAFLDSRGVTRASGSGR